MRTHQAFDTVRFFVSLHVKRDLLYELLSGISSTIFSLFESYRQKGAQFLSSSISTKMLEEKVHSAFELRTGLSTQTDEASII